MGRTVITGIFDGYERAKAPPPGADRCILVTDGEGDPRWEVARRPLIGLARTRAFFPAKLVPHLCGLGDDDVIWIDGSMETTGLDVGELFDLVPPGGVGMHRHGIRNDYFEEARFSVGHYGDEHDRGSLVMAQAAAYHHRGCPRQSGVWTSGIIVWRGAQRLLGERWFAEVMVASASDQVALPYAAWVTGTTITPLSATDVYSNPWFRYVPHGERGLTTAED